MTCILPGLYLGGLVCLNPSRLKDNEITHILSIFSGEIKSDEGTSFHRLHIEADDDEQQDLMKHFPKGIAFIHEARMTGGRCLVHCIGGISRSSTMVIAYVMALTGWKWREAFACVKGYRTQAFPNMNFQNQLRKFENMKEGAKGSPKDIRITLLKDYTPTQEEIDFLLAGKEKFQAHVKSALS